MSTEIEREKLFLSAPKFAVVGASKDQSKFGTKVYLKFEFHCPVLADTSTTAGTPVVSGAGQGCDSRTSRTASLCDLT